MILINFVVAHANEKPINKQTISHFEGMIILVSAGSNLNNFKIVLFFI
jgi:hypothetical protein